MRQHPTFRLGRVRRVREIEERAARAAWGRAEGEASAAEAHEAKRRRDLDDARRDLRRNLSPGDEGLDPARVLLADRAMDGQVRALSRACELARTLRDRAERMGAVWRGRERDRRALVELERRARERHRRELERRDNAQLDEEALARRERASRSAARRSTETDSSATPPASD